MTCPFCGSDDTNVTETRSAGKGRTRRRRICVCGKRFTTVEFVWNGTRGPTPEMVAVSKTKLAAALSELLFALEGDRDADEAEVKEVANG
jgi:transcriptional regulator NrdR family protein